MTVIPNFAEIHLEPQNQPAGSDGFKTIEGPVGGDTGFDLEDYVAKLQIDSDPAADIYQSLRFKVGYTDQTSEQTYLGLTDDDEARVTTRTGTAVSVVELHDGMRPASGAGIQPITAPNAVCMVWSVSRSPVALATPKSMILGVGRPS